MQFSFIYDSTKCIGCMACAVACQKQNAPDDFTPNMKLVTQEDTSLYSNQTISFISTACRFCIDGFCIESCPENALYRRSEDNLVLVNQDKCVGCGICREVCPYDGVGFNPNGRMAKCHSCVEDFKVGKDPICVQACKTKALKFGSLDSLLSEDRVRADLPCSDNMHDSPALERI